MTHTVSPAPENPELKLLPQPAGPPANTSGMVVTDSAPVAPTAPATAQPIQAPPRQLSNVPIDELRHLAEELGLDPTHFDTPQELVAAVHQHRQMIASLNRDAMVDVVVWGRRPVTVNATKEQLAQEIARIKAMRFSGLSHRGLVVLALIRGVRCSEAEPIPVTLKKLKKQEGLFAKLSRKRRMLLGSVVSKILGETGGGDYQFLPGPSDATAGTTAPAQPRSIKHEIEESGLIGGLAGRIKKSADGYVNQKLDEIEARIDRKLDEIDRRLGEWRDKEIANRIRILKITLWATIVVAAVSLIVSYIKVYIPH